MGPAGEYDFRPAGESPVEFLEIRHGEGCAALRRHFVEAVEYEKNLSFSQEVQDRLRRDIHPGRSVEVIVDNVFQAQRLHGVLQVYQDRDAAVRQASFAIQRKLVSQPDRKRGLPRSVVAEEGEKAARRPFEPFPHIAEERLNFPGVLDDDVLFDVVLLQFRARVDGL